MNQEAKLKLQAYLDQESSEAEARAMATWLDQDPEAKGLAAELREVRAVLAGNELEVKLPESREFYWSKIERAIRANEQEREAKATVSSYPWWLRVLAPAVGVAVLMLTALTLLKVNTAPSRLGYLHEIETPLEDTSSISFHSQSAGMTVVWVQTQAY
jgi:anti-sigma factor RsiW